MRFRFAPLALRGLGPLLLAGLAAVLAGCQIPPPEAREVSAGHLGATAEAVPPAQDIPAPVQVRPYVPLPEPAPPSETYTVVVNEVPVKELLFALARDAGVNIDVHPEVEGTVTLNAVDQTLTQILDRIGRQVNVSYENRNGTMIIGPDRPFLRTYKVDYVNMARDSSSTIETSTKVATTGTTGGAGGGGGGGGNTSETTVSNVSNNRIWDTLAESLRQIVRPERLDPDAVPDLQNVIVNPESGVIVVRATARQHELVQRYLDQVMANLHRQVLIEATIVEVELSDNYQSGVDWARLQAGIGNSGLAVSQAVLGNFAGPVAGVTGLLLDIGDQRGTSQQDVQLTVRLLKQFGETRVLSSPKVMALNNQTSILKVVDNEVYFTIELDEKEDDETNTTRTEIKSQVNTVPVGLVMNVTPQVNDSATVTLNVRPTITRIREFVDDPGVAIIAAIVGVAAQGAVNRVPVVQVRETETVLRVNDRQVAVLGGLMQDRRTRSNDGTPGLSDIQEVGGLFEFRERDSVKTELVIFLRATVVRSPSLDGDFSGFRQYLPENQRSAEPMPTPFKSF
ncbi:MAG: pilus (MSHA type) biogenesis protein MshL [Ectothiorhodospiraceae bacterium]|nr:pilus (MSHA type) biogenesis protein MshL [Chromatiales bacterium]MCP5156786.1 pilus (MSHA type) biogenesis protein MshL [Ectothiorhodospiraceae bacterium]